MIFNYVLSYWRKTRESEKQASHLINDIIANYGDVIPKKDFVELQKQYKALQESMSEKSAEFDQLKTEHEWAVVIFSMYSLGDKELVI